MLRYSVSEFSVHRTYHRGPMGRMLACGVVLIVILAGCRDKSSTNDQPATGGAASPIEVGVLTIMPQEITLTQDLPGRVSAFRIAEVRARVSGIVQKRLFTEGSTVKEGQVLYQIEPDSYEAALKAAEGSLARAQANVEAARNKANRYKQLVEGKAISKQDYDDALAMQHSYEADVLTGQADVDTARINLRYTQMAAPVTGRIGASQVTEGAYVQASGATLLATVQQIDQVYVDVTQSTTDLSRLKRAVAGGEIQTDQTGRARVRLLLDDGTEYGQEGTLQFSDVSVNTGTSSVIIRAIFPNPHHELLPGMFVRARLVEGQKKDALLVPQLAVTRNQKGEPTLFIATNKGTAELRLLETSRAIGNQWLVTAGLNAGDQVIVDNLQKIRDGVPIKPVPAKLAEAYRPKANVR